MIKLVNPFAEPEKPRSIREFAEGLLNRAKLSEKRALDILAILDSVGHEAEFERLTFLINNSAEDIEQDRIEKERVAMGVCPNCGEAHDEDDEHKGAVN